ncbi:Phytanoyl-CoA dioxygenase (PhyH) [Frankia sp. CpI1-P]|uniref:phytanoyl-CoA dioxygenase family protein n=1 Tax=Frankia sp. CpI1-P TaxID=1502734 RepID=UPI0007071FD3|nr:phytanoyl-CoA dioxygenase family protein [Frankia sp. CpI1-P]KQM07316.1 Phytanoyl-CoA dioxygenase (PhyH) [Frankia sp. CpI1-P]
MGSPTFVPAPAGVTRGAPSMPAVAEVGVFVVDTTLPDPLAAPALADLDDFYHRHGFVVLRGLHSTAFLDRVERECGAAQQAVLAGTVSERYGSTQYLDARYLNRTGLGRADLGRADLGRAGQADGVTGPSGRASNGTKPAGADTGIEADAEAYVNYVEHVEELAPAVRAAATHPLMVALLRRLLGADVWMSPSENAGVVFQDARPGRESGYSRIGWHSDWQAMPSLDVWPGCAFTLHVDATSPANGFLRVVPGSHRWATPAPYRNINNVAVPADARPSGGHTDAEPPYEMPLGFEKIPGEIAVYAERGDLLLHDAYLWHSAARATENATTRRHVRAGYYSGDPASYRDQFIKNAAR